MDRLRSNVSGIRLKRDNLGKFGKRALCIQVTAVAYGQTSYYRYQSLPDVHGTRVVLSLPSCCGEWDPTPPDSSMFEEGRDRRTATPSIRAAAKNSASFLKKQPHQQQQQQQQHTVRTVFANGPHRNGYWILQQHWKCKKGFQDGTFKMIMFAEWIRARSRLE